MLIDTGTEINVIEEGLLEKVKQFSKFHVELQMKGVEIIGRVGARSKKVTQQVYFQVSLGDVTLGEK